MLDVVVQDPVERFGRRLRRRARPGEAVHDQQSKLAVAVPNMAPQDLVARRARSRDGSDHARGQARGGRVGRLEERGERGHGRIAEATDRSHRRGRRPRVAERADRRHDGERVARLDRVESGRAHRDRLVVEQARGGLPVLAVQDAHDGGAPQPHRSVRVTSPRPVPPPPAVASRLRHPTPPVPRGRPAARPAAGRRRARRARTPCPARPASRPASSPSRADRASPLTSRRRAIAASVDRRLAARASGSSSRRRRSASHERRPVGAVQQDSAVHVHTAHTMASDGDHRGQGGGQRVQDEDQDAGGRDRDRDADALDRRLAAKRLRSGTTWYIALIDVRVVPSVRAMSAMRAADTTASSATEPPPAAAQHDDHEPGEHGDHERVGGDPQPQPEPAEQRTREQEQERDAHDVHDGGVAGEEHARGPRRSGTGRPRGRTRGSRRPGCRGRTAPGSRGSARRTAARTVAGARVLGGAGRRGRRRRRAPRLAGRTAA